MKANGPSETQRSYRGFLNGEPYRIYRSFLSELDHRAFMYGLPWITAWRPCPKWLGDFDHRVYGEAPAALKGTLGEGHRRLYRKLATLVRGQCFNTAFVQRYQKGCHVKPHRDPKDYRGFTVIGVFGAFEGAETVIGKDRFKLHSCDVLVQRCNHEGMPRPLHRVTPVTKGTRYTVILNTIKRNLD